MANVNQYKTLVTAGQVISNSFTNFNTDPALISSNTILLAELAHIKSALGKKFYEELKLQNDTDALTVANQALVDDFLVRCLSWFTRFEVINEVQSNSSSMGIVHNIDEFATIVDPSELNAYKQDTYRKSEIYLQDMLEFLNDSDNSALYPTYVNNRPSRGFAYKNHGIIMYDSIYTRYNNYTSWRDYCPPSNW
mgnify:FL=1|jgi:hypothetical protein|tara:strand:- start:132 stop:713 length:582 start_codon:yes stop_codon:yes gene_type:complete